MVENKCKHYDTTAADVIVQKIYKLRDAYNKELRELRKTYQPQFEYAAIQLSEVMGEMKSVQ